MRPSPRAPRPPTCWLPAALLAALSAASPAAALEPFPNAVVAKFVECYEAEGSTASADDRAVLERAAPQLARWLDRRLPEIDCLDTRAFIGRCIESVADLECDAFALQLAPVVSSAPPLERLPEWAEQQASSFGEVRRRAILRRAPKNPGVATPQPGDQEAARKAAAQITQHQEALERFEARAEGESRVVVREMRQAFATLLDGASCETGQREMQACEAAWKALECKVSGGPSAPPAP